MIRRYFGIALGAFLVGCTGAGVSTTDLRKKVAEEVAQIVVNREQISPWTAPLDPARIDAAIASVQADVASRHMDAFAVEQLHDLRRFYSSPDGQAAVAIAYATEGNGARPNLDPEQTARIKTAFNDPVTARSIAALRETLRAAFNEEFAF